MPRSPKDNQEIRDARREALLSAAIGVFGERGYGRTKISDIAAAAGMSHGLVYHYFSSKDAILEAIVDAMIAHIDADLKEDRELPPLERVKRSLERARERCKEGGKADSGRIVALAMLEGAVPERVKRKLSAHMSATFHAVVTRIKEGQKSGDFDSECDAKQLASALVCLVRGMSIRLPGVELPFALPRAEVVLRLLHPKVSVPRGPADPISSESLGASSPPRRPPSQGAPHGKRKARNAAVSTFIDSNAHGAPARPRASSRGPHVTRTNRNA